MFPASIAEAGPTIHRADIDPETLKKFAIPAKSIKLNRKLFADGRFSCILYDRRFTLSEPKNAIAFISETYICRAWRKHIDAPQTASGVIHILKIWLLGSQDSRID
jgi:hypothetical protein